MTKDEAKKKIKVGDVLIDDCNLVYKVIDKLPNSLITQSIGGGSPEDVACEVITFACIENEGWRVVV